MWLVTFTMHPRVAQISDAPEIARIYNHAIEHTVASFWAQPRTVDDITAWMTARGPRYPWLVLDAPITTETAETAASHSPLAGVAWCQPWNPRDAYAGTAESTIYICPTRQGRGHGRTLYRDLFARIDTLGYRHTIAGVTLPNDASVRLHESMGFVHTGTFHGIGVKFGQVLDVGYWQRVSPRLATPYDQPDAG